MPVTDIRSQREFDNAIAKYRYLMINFTMVGCQPCAMVKPSVESLSDLSDYSAVGFIRVEVHTVESAATQFRVSSAPQFVFLELGKEVKRVSGGDLPQIIGTLKGLQAKADAEGYRIPRASDGLEFKTEALNQGYDALNPTIDFQGFEALNVQGPAKLVFKVNTTGNGVWLDADSQLMFYVPFMNLCKVHSILIKARSGVVIDEDDGEQAQRPAKVKVWPNLPLPLLFEDAEADNNPAHSELVKFDGDWTEIRLKLVRFQKVQLLCVFIDGDDEDTPTLVDKIVVVGILGDLMEVTPLPRDGH